MDAARNSFRFCFVALFFTTACFPEFELDDRQRHSMDSGVRDTQASESHRITVATYNVEDFDLGGKGEAQHAHVARFARASGVDVLVFQEMQHGTGSDDAELFTRALETISYAMPHHAVSTMSDGFNAIGVFSRLPLGDAAEVLPENTRTVYRFQVLIGQIPLWFYGCHLKSGTDAASRGKRKQEAMRLASFIIESHNLVAEHLDYFVARLGISLGDLKQPIGGRDTGKLAVELVAEVRRQYGHRRRRG